jgi:hypothetical protein
MERTMTNPSGQDLPFALQKQLFIRPRKIPVYFITAAYLIIMIQTSTEAPERNRQSLSAPFTAYRPHCRLPSNPLLTVLETTETCSPASANVRGALQFSARRSLIRQRETRAGHESPLWFRGYLGQ